MDWLLKETTKEISFAQADLLKIKSDVASFLKGKQKNKRTRKKRALPLAAAAVGAIGLFGGGIMFGSGDCGIMGIFGSCQEKAKQNARNIEKLGEYAISLCQNIQQLANATAAKFFRVSNWRCYMASKGKSLRRKTKIGEQLKNGSTFSDKTSTR